MSFQTATDIEEALGSGAVSVRDLYAIWEQREPVPEAIAAKGAVATGADAPHIAWLQEKISLAHQFTKRELEKCAGDAFQPKLERSLKADLLLQLGHIVREESHQAASSAERFQTADEALDFYRRALALEPDRLEALISAAAAAFITGDLGPRRLGQAKEQARQILALTAQHARTQTPT